MIWASVGPLIITTNAKFIMNLCTILGTKHNRLYSTLQRFGNFWNKASTNKLCRAENSEQAWTFCTWAKVTSKLNMIGQDVCEV